MFLVFAQSVEVPAFIGPGTIAALGSSAAAVVVTYLFLRSKRESDAEESARRRDEAAANREFLSRIISQLEEIIREKATVIRENVEMSRILVKTAQRNADLMESLVTQSAENFRILGIVAGKLGADSGVKGG
jgi:hypothetical protein